MANIEAATHSVFVTAAIIVTRKQGMLAKEMEQQGTSNTCSLHRIRMLLLFINKCLAPV